MGSRAENRCGITRSLNGAKNSPRRHHSQARGCPRVFRFRGHHSQARWPGLLVVILIARTRHRSNCAIHRSTPARPAGTCLPGESAFAPPSLARGTARGARVGCVWEGESAFAPPSLARGTGSGARVGCKWERSGCLCVEASDWYGSVKDTKGPCRGHHSQARGWRGTFPPWGQHSRARGCGVTFPCRGQRSKTESDSVLTGGHRMVRRGLTCAMDRAGSAGANVAARRAASPCAGQGARRVIREDCVVPLDGNPWKCMAFV